MVKLADLSFLIVDDMATIRVMTQNLLKEFGVSKITAKADAFDAWEHLKSVESDSSLQPQFIISDWNMPKMKGVELLKNCRSSQAYKDIPFMMLTGETEIDIVKEVIAAGVDAYVTKPFTPKQFKEKLAVVFKKKVLARGK